MMVTGGSRRQVAGLAAESSHLKLQTGSRESMLEMVGLKTSKLVSIPPKTHQTRPPSTWRPNIQMPGICGECLIQTTIPILETEEGR